MSTVIQTNIEEEIVRLSKSLEDATGLLSVRAQEAATADINYKRESSKAALRAEGKNAAEREAEVFLVTEQEYAARRISEAHHSSQLEVCRSLRSQLSALQTLVRIVSQQAGTS